MLNQTFGLKEVASYINALFYPIKIDIYSKNSITFFDGTIYKNTGKDGAVHEIVTKLLGENVQMPDGQRGERQGVSQSDHEANRRLDRASGFVIAINENQRAQNQRHDAGDGYVRL